MKDANGKTIETGDTVNCYYDADADSNPATATTPTGWHLGTVTGTYDFDGGELVTVSYDDYEGERLCRASKNIAKLGDHA